MRQSRIDLPVELVRRGIPWGPDHVPRAGLSTRNIIEAYGFDLSPLALRYGEFFCIAAGSGKTHPRSSIAQRNGEKRPGAGQRGRSGATRARNKYRKDPSSTLDPKAKPDERPRRCRHFMFLELS
jgi:hypothetical protein